MLLSGDRRRFKEAAIQHFHQCYDKLQHSAVYRISVCLVLAKFLGPNKGFFFGSNTTNMKSISAPRLCSTRTEKELLSTSEG